MIGCLLIATGTLAVAMGGTLTRFGSDQYLYIAMSIGVAMIFAGYVWTKRREGAEARRRGVDGASRRGGGQASSRASVSLNPQLSTLNPAVAFVESRLRSLSDDELIEECRVWSVPARAIDAFSRAEARRVWSFRNRLTPDGQAALDTRPAGLRLQLAELYFDVMTPEISAVDRSPIAPLDRIAGRDQADSPAARVSAGSVD